MTDSESQPSFSLHWFHRERSQGESEQGKVRVTVILQEERAGPKRKAYENERSVSLFPLTHWGVRATCGSQTSLRTAFSLQRK